MIDIERHGTATAVGAFLVVAVAGVLARPLLPVDETRYLAVAWEMRLGGDWLVPHLNGGIYTDKPPLLFWLINLTWGVFGVSEVAARLVGPAAGAAAVAATAALARRLWPDERIAGRAALVLVGFASFTAYAGLTMFDALLTLAVVLGIGALAGGGRWAWAGLGAAVAMGVLAKGPVVLLHLGPAALLAPLWSAGRWRPALARAGKAFGFAAALTALWLLPAISAGGPAYRHAVLWTQSAGRMAHSFAHARAWWFFMALLPLILWPWAWSLGLWRRTVRPKLDPGLRLCLVWALAALALFSLISGKQAHYLLPALPAAALIWARALGGAPAARGAALLPFGLAAALFALGRGFGPPELAAQAGPAPVIALVVVLLVAIGVAALLLRGPAVAVLGPALVLALDVIFLGAPGRLHDPGAVARLVAPHDGRIAVLWSNYAGEFTFAARLRHPVAEVESPAEARAWMAATPGGVVVARLDRTHPYGDPIARVDFDSRPLGLWTSDAVSGITNETNKLP